MKHSHILSFSDWALNEQGGPDLSTLPPPRGVTADSTSISMPGRNYKTGNEDYINQLRILSPEEARKNDEFYAQLLAFGVAFVPLVGPLMSAGLLAGIAATAYQKGDNKKAGKEAFFAGLTLAIPALSMLKNISRLGAEGLKMLQLKLDKGEKLYSVIELAGLNEIKQNPQLIAKSIETAIAAKGISTKGLNLEQAAKEAFKA